MSIIDGDINDNVLIGTSSADTISGFGGNDTITGAGGNDTLDGGSGDDTFLVGGINDGLDTFIGGDGFDRILATSDDTVIGIFGNFLNDVEEISADGYNNVTILGRGSASILDFSNVNLVGISAIDGAGGSDTIVGSSADDTIIGGQGNDVLDGGAGNDTFLVGGVDDGFDSFTGGDGFDRIVATTEGTIIGISGLFVSDVEEISAGGFSNVVIKGRGGADTLDFSNVNLVGIAEIDGDGGADAITGSSGDDVIIGGQGNDVLDGGAGNDTFLVGGVDDGTDTYSGGDGFDRILATEDGTEIGIHGNFVGDVEEISADGHQNVVIKGRSGVGNTLDFSNTNLIGIDRIEGGSGADTITGSSGDEIILAGDGNDVLNGGGGNDILDGGAGDNEVVLSGNASDYDINALVDENGNPTYILTNITTGDTVEVRNISTADFADSQNFDLNTLPIAVDDNASVTEDASGTLEETVSGSLLLGDAQGVGADVDPDTANGIELSLTPASIGTFEGQYGTLTILEDGSYSYVLNNASVQFLKEGEQVQEQFDYTIEEAGGLTDTATLTVNVTGTNDTPIVDPVFLGSTDEDNSLIFTQEQLLANASDIDGDNLTVTSVNVTASSLAAGILFDNGDGTWRFTPNQDFNGDGIELSFNVSDGIETVQSTATFDINAVNDAPILSQPEPSGDRLVNSFTTGNQNDASTTALADGGWVVTWTSFNQDGSGSGVYAQRYNAQGEKFGDEFQVNTNTAGVQAESSITALVDGGYIVAWATLGPDGSGTGIATQRYNADGTAAGVETRVNTFVDNDQEVPQITALANGGWVVVWQSEGQDGSGAGVYGQVFDAQGAKTGSEFQVNSEVNNDQSSPVVASLGDGFVISWASEGQDGSGEGVFAQRYDGQGGALGSEFQVNTATANDQGSPVITQLEGGGFVVAWQSLLQDGSGFGVYTQAFDASGQAIGQETLVNTRTGGNELTPSITALAGGGYAVTWRSDFQDGSGRGVYGQIFDATGAPVGGELQINTTTSGDQDEPTITGLADGGFVATWTSANNHDGSGDGVFQRVFSADGTVRVNDTQAIYEENAAPVQITSDLRISDVDSATLQGASVRITDYVEGEDRLVFADANGIVGNFDETTGVLTLSGEGTLEVYQSALRTVAYENTSEAPTGTERNIEFQVTDGGAENDLSNLVVKPVTVVSINDAPDAQDDSGTVVAGEGVDIDVLANDSDIEGDALEVIAASAGNGSVVINPDGSLSYTSNASEAGIDTITYTISDGNGGEDTANVNLTVLSPIQTPGVPDLVSGSDRGISPSDNVTNDTTPTFEIDISDRLREGDFVDLLDGGIVRGTHEITADDVANGYVVITASSSLSDGVHGFSAVGRDASGNVTDPSSSLSVRIDTVRPNIGRPDLLTDTGISPFDEITSETTLRFRISYSDGAIASTIRLYRDGQRVSGQRTVSFDNGSVVIEIDDATSGNYTARGSDRAGNWDSSSSQEVIVDTVDPNTPGTPNLLSSSDSGNNPSDNYTRFNRPEFSVSTFGLTQGDRIELLADGITIATVSLTATNISDGFVNITSSISLSGSPEETYLISARALDKAGNESSFSSSLPVTIDNRASAIPGTPQIVGGTETRPRFRVSTQGLSADDRIQIRDNNSSVRLIILTDQDIAQGYAEATLTYDLDVGIHQFTSRSVDLAGNVSGASSSESLTIRPATPGTPDLITDSTASFGDFTTDNITNDTTPTFKVGVAGLVVNDRIQLREGSTILQDYTLSQTDIDNGYAEITITTDITDNRVYDIRAWAVDGGDTDNVSLGSNTIGIRIDDTVATPGEPRLTSGGTTTPDNTPLITVPIPGLGHNVLITLLGTDVNGNDVILGQGVTTPQNVADNEIEIQVTHPFDPNPAITHIVRAIAEDVAGNVSGESSELRINISSPSAPTIQSTETQLLQLTDAIASFERRGANEINFSLREEEAATTVLASPV